MKFIPNAITQKFGRQLLLAEKGAPKWLFAAGIAGTVVSTVLACKATLKLEGKLEDMQNDINDIKSRPAPTNGVAIDVKQDRKDLAYAYAKGSADIIKLYAPAVVVGTISIAALTKSHVMLTQRNMALTAAFGALQTSFDQYRERVKEEIGEEKERDIHNGIVREKVTVDGKVKTVAVKKPGFGSPYARVFDELNRNWTKNADLNRNFILCQQNHLNDLLQARGHVFLNEAYDLLGMERTPAGQAVGWVVNNPNGDGMIDFGIYAVYEDKYVNAGFINGAEPSILLDFNVDGEVWNLIG